jgi:hypothetical protein
VILNEVLNSPVKFKWLHSDSELGIAKFFGGANEVMVEFHEVDNPLPNKHEDPDYPKPEAITFTAEEPSRIKLYDRFIKRFTASGYRVYDRGQVHNGMAWVLFKQ